MELLEAIAKRHSYRGSYKDDPVPRQDLERIVQAGIQAPSGWNAQTVTFVIIDDQQILKRIAEVMPEGSSSRITSSAAAIACVINPNKLCGGQCYTVEDCAAATENMLLVITALGYATVWTDGALRKDNCAEQIGQILGVPKENKVRILLPIGIPTESLPQQEKQPFNQRAWFNQYGD